MRLFYAAEIVGKAGITAFKHGIEKVRSGYHFDFCLAGADGVTGGAGLGKQHAAYLRKLGAECLTLGDMCFLKKDMTESLGEAKYVLRPANMVSAAPGFGQHIFHDKNGKRPPIGVGVILGQAGFTRMHGDNMYIAARELAERLKRETPFVVIDIHASATAEKRTLFHTLAGKCTAIIGSHTRVQTADEEVKDGTAYITDAGRTGRVDSVGGMASAPVIGSYLSGIPEWSRENETPGETELQGVIIEADDAGRALSVERVKIPIHIS